MWPQIEHYNGSDVNLNSARLPQSDSSFFSGTFVYTAPILPIYVLYTHHSPTLPISYYLSYMTSHGQFRSPDEDLRKWLFESLNFFKPVLFSHAVPQSILASADFLL